MKYSVKLRFVWEWETDTEAKDAASAIAKAALELGEEGFKERDELCREIGTGLEFLEALAAYDAAKKETP